MERADGWETTMPLEDSAGEAPAERDVPRNSADRIGRYRLIGELGAGAMGVVYLAEDPELDRQIALKVVRTPSRGNAQASLVAEAQSMARLQHPNVVAVHDVGLDHGRVFVAMELVKGITLSHWLATERRDWREILTVFVGAARGLAAAHGAGLVHRDFKPDNVLIDRQRVARLCDFGLARPPAEQGERKCAGTPPYMAPEQHDGAPVTEAADQFAFATALWDALFGSLPFRGKDVVELADAKRLGRIATPPRGKAPRWLAQVLQRALAPVPSARFASLAALERALVRGLGRRRRAVVASAGFALSASAFIIGNLHAARDVATPCSGAAAESTLAWNPAIRDRLASHLRQLSPYGREEAQRLDRDLEAFANRWAGGYHAACLANARGELTAPIYERELACLERSRVAFETAVDMLGGISAHRLSDAIVAARSLPEASRCRTEALVVGAPLPPTQLASEAAALALELERARVYARTRDPDARKAAAAAVAHSEQLGYRPLIARAYLVAGMAMLSVDDTLGAIPALDRAANTALGVGDDPMFIEAYAREIFAIAITEAAQLPPQAARALGALPFAEQIAVRLGPGATFARPLLFNNAGIALRSAGDNAGARAWFGKALDEPRTREGDLELASAYGNLALVTVDPAQRHHLMAQERAMIERLVGANHVMTLDARLKASIFVANPLHAAAEQRELCDRYRRFHPTTARSRIDLCLYQLGWLAEERGDVAEARSAFAGIPESGSPQDLAARVHRRLLAGQPRDALREAHFAIARLKGEWWTRIYAVDAQIALAEAQVQLARASDAIGTLQQALLQIENLASMETGEDRPRRIARIRARLAMLEQTRDRAAAHAHARGAAAWYRAAGGYGSKAETLEAIAHATRSR
jgi:eukaryotic-like serine/threonine-protein kinase